MLKLLLLGEFPEVMVTTYNAFISPHFEYCFPVFVGLSSGLSNKLRLTNQCDIRSLMSMSKSSSYSDLPLPMLT